MDSILSPIGTLLGEIERLALVTIAFTLIIFIAECWHRYFSPQVEWTRKFTHVCCGIIIAFLPWIFGSYWTLLIWAAGLLAFFLIVRKYHWLASTFGIKRKSYGELYFLLAVLILFPLGDPVYYMISFLTLTLADSLAAIIGSTYEKFTYTIREANKSVEGSLIFFLSTFLIVHIPLLLLTPIGELDSVLIGVLVALIVTVLEAVSLQGLDNLIIPVATYFLISFLAPLVPNFIAELIAITIFSIGAVFVISRALSKKKKKK